MFRRLDVNDDWTFGGGMSNYATGVEEISFNAKTRILSFYQDCFFDATAGIDWWRYLGSTKQDQLIRRAVGNTLMATPGISTIDELIVFLNKDRQLALSYAGKTIVDVEFQDEYVVLTK